MVSLSTTISLFSFSSCSNRPFRSGILPFSASSIFTLSSSFGLSTIFGPALSSSFIRDCKPAIAAFSFSSACRRFNVAGLSTNFSTSTVFSTTLGGISHCFPPGPYPSNQSNSSSNSNRMAMMIHIRLYPGQLDDMTDCLLLMIQHLHLIYPARLLIYPTCLMLPFQPGLARFPAWRV